MTVNASPSAIYRSIGLVSGDPPTILLDEDAETNTFEQLLPSFTDVNGIVPGQYPYTGEALGISAPEEGRTLQEENTEKMRPAPF